MKVLMAAIDSLLGIVSLKKAEGLVLAAGEVPALLLGGGRTPLTMPPLAPSMLEVFVDELLSEAQKEQLRATGAAESGHEVPGTGSFVVRVRTNGGKLSLTAKKGTVTGKGAATKETSAPLPTAPPAPTSDVTQLAPATARAAPLDEALDQAITRRASDLWLSAGAAPVLRIDGELAEVRGASPTPPESLAAFLDPLLDAPRRECLDRTGSVDLSYVRPALRGEPLRFRVNVFRHLGGIGAAFRPIRSEPPSLESLHLPRTLTELVRPRHGLVLMTGATGSGKSTTLTALVDHVNRTRACHVVTLEDPIEYVHRRQRALIHQREIGTHADSFAAGMRAALREAPDLILVGELRDPETIRMALTAAETGHLVLSTLHSGNTRMAIERIVDVFGEGEKVHVRQQLAGSLRYVVTQQLVPGVQGGRLPAVELLSVNAAIAAQIREGRTHMMATQMELDAAEGMISMERALLDLVRSGRVAPEAALDAAPDRPALERLLLERGGAPRRGPGAS
jgi:twitching motility protein PilT